MLLVDYILLASDRHVWAVTIRSDSPDVASDMIRCVIDDYHWGPGVHIQQAYVSPIMDMMYESNYRGMRQWEGNKVVSCRDLGVPDPPWAQNDVISLTSEQQRAAFHRARADWEYAGWVSDR
jgi:hypothetical protein